MPLHGGNQALTPVVLMSTGILSASSVMLPICLMMQTLQLISSDLVSGGAVSI